MSWLDVEASGMGEQSHLHSPDVQAGRDAESDEDQGQQRTRPDVCGSGSVPYRFEAANPVRQERGLHFYLGKAEGKATAVGSDHERRLR